MILDRPRHAAIIESIRSVGARVFLIRDGDVAGAISAATPRSGVDLLYGIGGTPEGVIAAAALKCMGGEIQGTALPPRRRRARSASGRRLRSRCRAHDGRPRDRRGRVLRRDRRSPTGTLLRGVQYWPDGATTYSMVMRSRSGTMRWVEAQHRFEKLEEILRRSTYRR